MVLKGSSIFSLCYEYRNDVKNGKIMCDTLKQGFSNFFLEGPDEIPMKPQRAG